MSATNSRQAVIEREAASECADCDAALDRGLDPPGVCTACWRRRHNGWDPR